MDPYLRTPEMIDCRDPATGELLGDVPAMGEADVVAAIHRARFLQPRWAALSIDARRTVLRSLLERIVRNQDELCRLAAHDSGETMLDAMVHEVVPIGRALTALIHERGSAAQRRRHREPGIVGYFTPGYLPLRYLVLPIAPALLHGSAVVVKVSDRVAWSSLQFAELVGDVLAEHGHSRELVQLVTGPVESGEALADAGTDRIVFVGTAQTSRSVAAAASVSQTPVFHDIEVCRPILIDANADPDRALQPAMRRIFAAAGQIRGGAPIVYVHRKHYDRFIDRAARLIASLRLGSPLELTTDCGPLINPSRIEPLERLLDDAVGRGATMRVGGRRRPDVGPSFFEPTLITGIEDTMLLTQERLLGPVMAVHPFEYRSELPSPAPEPTAHDREIERAMRAIPLYPARGSTFALLESAVQAAYGRGMLRKAEAVAALGRHGLTDLRTRALRKLGL